MYPKCVVSSAVLSPRINTHQFLAPPFCGGTARSCSRLLLNPAANYKLLGVLSIINTPHIAQGAWRGLGGNMATLPRNEAMSRCVHQAIKTL